MGYRAAVRTLFASRIPRRYETILELWNATKVSMADERVEGRTTLIVERQRHAGRQILVLRVVIKAMRYTGTSDHTCLASMGVASLYRRVSPSVISSDEKDS